AVARGWRLRDQPLAVDRRVGLEENRIGAQLLEGAQSIRVRSEGDRAVARGAASQRVEANALDLQVAEGLIQPAFGAQETAHLERGLLAAADRPPDEGLTQFPGQRRAGHRRPGDVVYKVDL